MWVLWVSGSTDTPKVHYSTEPLPAMELSASFSVSASVSSLAEVKTVAGSSGTYRALDMCSAPANQTGQQLFIDPGYMHRVLLTGQSITHYNIARLRGFNVVQQLRFALCFAPKHLQVLGAKHVSNPE